MYFNKRFTTPKFTSVAEAAYNITLGKLLEMCSEIASSHVTCVWFITCTVRLPVVMLLVFGLLHVQ